MVASAAIPAAGIAPEKVKLYVPMELDTAEHERLVDNPDIAWQEIFYVSTVTPTGTVSIIFPVDGTAFMVFKEKV